MRGRKPKPTALRLLQGNPGKRAINRNEPKPAPVDTIDPPETLKGEARDEWIRRAPQLIAVGLLTEVDVPAFLVYCQSWARLVESEVKLAATGEVVKTPSGYPVINPYRTIANKALTQCQQFWSEFGMMPSSRSRVGGRMPKAPGRSVTRVERFMARAK